MSLFAIYLPRFSQSPCYFPPFSYFTITLSTLMWHTHTHTHSYIRMACFTFFNRQNVSIKSYSLSKKQTNEWDIESSPMHELSCKNVLSSNWEWSFYPSREWKKKWLLKTFIFIIINAGKKNSSNAFDFLRECITFSRIDEDCGQYRSCDTLLKNVFNVTIYFMSTFYDHHPCSTLSNKYFLVK